MRKLLSCVCMLCLLLALASCAALPSSEDAWQEQYWQLALEAFNAWNVKPRMDSFCLSYNLRDLNRDGAPELFLKYTDMVSKPFQGVYTVLGGKLCKFEDGPQERKSAARYYMTDEYGDGDGNTYYDVTYYDFETCTTEWRSFINAEEERRDHMAEQAAQFGLAGGVPQGEDYYEEGTFVIVRAKDYFGNIGTAMRSYRLAHLLLGASEEEMRRVFLEVLEEVWTHPLYEARTYPEYTTTGPVRTAGPGPD